VTKVTIEQANENPIILEGDVGLISIGTLNAETNTIDNCRTAFQGDYEHICRLICGASARLNVDYNEWLNKRRAAKEVCDAETKPKEQTVKEMFESLNDEQKATLYELYGVKIRKKKK